jgi:hypothetical protein
MSARSAITAARARICRGLRFIRPVRFSVESGGPEVVNFPKVADFPT